MPRSSIPAYPRRLSGRGARRTAGAFSVFGATVAAGVLGSACASDDATARESNATKRFGAEPDGGSVAPGRVLDLPACATSSAIAETVPLYLVFVFDRSSSMELSSKWDACKTGMGSFFASNDTVGLNASLTFFPASRSCGVAQYATPVVPMHALPDDAEFSNALAETAPDGETPTLPALQGAVAYAKDVRASIKDSGKVAIVLVTDGEPNGCGSTMTSVSALAQGEGKDFPLYVVGVGGDLSGLNPVAAAGGTKSAILLRTEDPDELRGAFQNALHDVRRSASCDIKLPSPPPGNVIDLHKVNVVASTDSTSNTLTYDQACAGGRGWHYDDPKTPTRIQLCETSCTEVSKTRSRIDTTLGCATIGDVPK